MFLKQPTLWVSLAAILAIAGCGGGGGSDKPKTPGTNPPVTTPGDNNSGVSVTLSGVATKGVLKGAQVTAYELDSRGQRLSAAVGTALTKADGSYELELASAYTGGLIEVEVSVIAGTKMVCDAAQCGDAAQAEEIDLPADFTLTAIVEKPAASNTVSASVTAWSTMAAKRTKALAADAKSLADAAKQANAEVSQVVGFDIAKTTSKGLSQLGGATAAQTQYAVMNAAVAEILFAGGEGDLTARLNSFTSALEDGVVGNASDSLNLAELSGAVRDVAGRVTLDAGVVEAINNQAAQYDAAGKDGLKPEYDEDLVVDEGATQAEKIEKFQTFIAQARTWISQAQGLDTAGITDAVGVDAESVEAILSSDEDFAFVGLVLDEAGRFMVANASSLQDFIESGLAQNLEITDRAGAQIGSAAMTFADEGGLTISVVGSVSGEAPEHNKTFNLVLDTNLPLDVILISDESEEGDIYVSLGLAKMMASTSLNLSGYVGDGQNNPLTLHSLSVNLELSQALDATTELAENPFESLAFGGDVTIAKDGVTFSGAIGVKFVKLISGFEGFYASPISVEYFRVSGEFSNAEGHSFAASAALDIKNASTFDVFAWADYSGNGSSLYRSLDYSVAESVIGEGVDELDYWHFSIGGYVGEVYSYYGGRYVYGGETLEEDRLATEAEMKIADDAARMAVAEEFAGMPGLVDGITIDWVYIGGNSDGYAWVDVYYQLPNLETTDNFAKAAFSLSAKVNIPELQSAQVTATVNRTALKGGSALANVKWNGGDYTIAVNSEDIEAAEQVNIRFFNSQGYELNVQTGLDDKGEISITSGKALLNGEQVGSVELRRGLPVIVYPNGSEDIFESLF